MLGFDVTIFSILLLKCFNCATFELCVTRMCNVCVYTDTCVHVTLSCTTNKYRCYALKDRGTPLYPFSTATFEPSQRGCPCSLEGIALLESNGAVLASKVI